MSCCENKSLRWTIALAVKKQINEIYDILSCNTDSSENKAYLFMRAVLYSHRLSLMVKYCTVLIWTHISVPRKPKFVKCYSLFMTIIRYVCREINCGNPRNTKSCVKRGKNGSKIARKWSI